MIADSELGLLFLFDITLPVAIVTPVPSQILPE